MSARMILSPLHSFGDCILMGAGKSGKYQLTAIRLTGRKVHSGCVLIHFDNLWYIGKVKYWVHSMRKQVECKGNQVNISGAVTFRDESANSETGEVGDSERIAPHLQRS